MTELILKKKEIKRKKFLDAAYALFKKNGISNTSISDICTEAGIAKGTFYLYFKDKDDIIKALTNRISMMILHNAFDKVKDSNTSFVESGIIMADYLIDLFKSDIGLVLLLHKDFAWPVNEEEFLHSEDPTIKNVNFYINIFSQETKLTVHQILIRLFSILSMICSVSYSALVDHFPEDIDSIKPEIYAMIRGSFTTN